MTATLFFSLVPAVVETLTRLPLEQPLAEGPDSSIVKMGLLIMLVLFIAIMVYQAIKLKNQRKGLTPAM
jgi:hypothetical protein